MRLKKQFIILAVLVFAGLFGIHFYQSSRPVVEVVAARRGTAVYAVYGTVKVVPTVTFSVHARSVGILKYSDPLAQATNLVGLEITNGQLLGEIMNESLDRDFAKADAELSAAQDRQKLGPAGAPALKTQEALVVRLEKLVALSNVPPSDVEHAENDLTTSRELVRQQEIEIDRSLNVARQEFDNLKQQKDRCKLFSPFDGLINAYNAVDGEFLIDGSIPFVLVTKTSKLEGQVNEEDVGHVAGKMKATVKLFAYPDRELTATVQQVLPTVNNQRYTVNLTLDQPPDNLMSGETGEMNIISGARENALLIPSRALVVDRVWVVQDGVVQPRTVKIGFHSIERAEILDGVHEGDLVVVADQDLLRTGQRVRAITLNQ
jgi:RND family efflux transporter MFP subunit